MAVKTITQIVTENPLEALYVYLADKSSAPVKSATGVWELSQTAKNKKAIAALEGGKGAGIAISDLTEKNLAVVGLTLSGGAPQKRRGRPAGKGNKAAAGATAAAPKKRGRKGGKGSRRRLDAEMKKFIADLASKGKGQTEVQRTFAEKYGYEPSYATIHNYVTAARKSK